MSDAHTDPTETLRKDEYDAERRAWRRAVLISAGLVLAVFVINALSIGTEMRWQGSRGPAHLPWVQEGTAILPMLLAIPVILWLGRRFPFERGRYTASLAVHAAGLLLYSGFQIVFMFSLRDVIWPAIFDQAYSISGTALDAFIYEFRKQALAYAGFQFVLSTDMTLERARLEARAAHSEAQDRQRITLKCGGTVRLLEAESFQTARAAGNYVEARFDGREHLARMTLTELERLLTEAGPIRPALLPS